MGMKLIVRFWNGDKQLCNTRNQAVAIIKKTMRGWMMSDDWLDWCTLEGEQFLQDGDHNSVYVLTNLSEPTGAWAAIYSNERN